MTLRRKAIRHALVAAIKAGVPEFEGRVFPHRLTPAREPEAPFAAVFSTGEPAIRQVSSSPVHHARPVRFTVHIGATGPEEDIEDLIDELAQKVEDVIWRDEPLAARTLTSSIELVSIEGPGLDAQGATVHGDLGIVFEITYEADPLEDHGPTDDLELVHAEFETHAPRTGPEAVADIVIEVATP